MSSIAVLLAIVSSSSVSLAQDAVGNWYLQLVQRFANGEVDHVLQELAAGPQTREKAAVDSLLRTRPDLKTIKAAAMLETSVGFRTIIGRNTDAGRFHFDVARNLVRALSGRESSRFKAQWHLFVGMTFVTLGELGEARTYVAAGMAEAPSDARLRFVSALILESTAMSNVTPPTRLGQRQGRPREIMLANAGREYRKVLALEETFSEARVHLGRVLSLTGDHATARAELASVVASTEKDASLLYLAHLFLGRLAADDGDLKTAKREYEAARDACPEAPTSYIALSELDHRMGLGGSAREYILSHTKLRVSVAGSADVDPWWSYLVGRSAQLQLLARWLREEIRP